LNKTNKVLISLPDQEPPAPRWSRATGTAPGAPELAWW